MSMLRTLQLDQVKLDELRGLARFILAMQKADGSFHSKYIPSEGGRSDKWISLYYPGEAALGLVMLYKQDNDPRWIKGALDTLLYLARIREGKKKVPADHWALIATKEIWPYVTADHRKILRAHARRVVDFILSEQVWEPGSIAHGGFTPDGRTTPTATRLEGLLAAEFLFRDDSEYHRKLRISMSWAMRFSLSARFTKGPNTGAVPRAIARIMSNHRDARTFNRRATEVRIDYVQHALSAFLQYADFLRTQRQ